MFVKVVAVAPAVVRRTMLGQHPEVFTCDRIFVLAGTSVRHEAHCRIARAAGTDWRRCLSV